MTQEPKTQAGRALLGALQELREPIMPATANEMILAIEAEAAAPYEERLRILIKAVEDHMADPSNVAEAAAAPAAPDDPWPNDGEEWEDTSEPAAAEPPDERGKRLIAYLADAWATSLTDYPERSQQQIAAREAYHDALEAARSLFGERAAQPPTGVTPALAHSSDSIDVERLARALDNLESRTDLSILDDGDYPEFAALIAAEYNRLAGSLPTVSVDDDGR